MEYRLHRPYVEVTMVTSQFGVATQWGSMFSTGAGSFERTMAMKYRWSTDDDDDDDGGDGGDGGGGDDDDDGGDDDGGDDDDDDDKGGGE